MICFPDRLAEARYVVSNRAAMPPSLVAMSIRFLRQWAPAELVPTDLPAGVVPFPVRRNTSCTSFGGDLTPCA